MGFLDMFQGSPLKRLEKEATENPSPENLLALAQKQVEMGLLDEALLVTERGIKQYPHFPRLGEFRMFIRKKRAQEPLRTLKEDIALRPSSQTYCQLIGIYRDLGDIEAALDACAEALEKFPGSEAVWLLSAQVRLESFLREVIAYDGIHALHSLNRVLELNEANSQARQMLSQLYYAIGANALSVREMRKDLELSGQPAKDVERFLDDLGEPAELPDGTSVEDLIERVEDEGALPNSLAGFPRVHPGLVEKTQPPPRINPAAVQSRLHDAGTQAGVRNIMVLDRAGTVIASIQGSGALDKAMFSKLAADISAVSAGACRRMDIGSLSTGAVRFGTGGIALRRQRGLTFTLLYDEPVKHDRALAILQELVVQTLGAGGNRA